MQAGESMETLLHNKHALEKCARCNDCRAGVLSTSGHVRWQRECGAQTRGKEHRGNQLKRETRKKGEKKKNIVRRFYNESTSAI